MADREKMNISDAMMIAEDIDYEQLVGLLSPIVFFYASHRFLDNYRLHRDFKAKNIEQIKIQPEISCDTKEFNLKKFSAKEYNYAIYTFYSVMKNNFDDNQLAIFYKNINNLKVVNSNNGILYKIFLNTNYVANYDSSNNKIRIYNPECYTAIYHELIHMSSSIHKNGIHYTGFKQYSIKPGSIVNIGQGINEGYTQLLTERYFGYSRELRGVYEYEMHLMKNIEKVIGKDKMEELFFKANLKGLIEELNNYISEDEVLSFINNVDFLNKHLKDDFHAIEKGMIENSIKNTSEFTLKIYIIDIYNKYRNGEITSADVEKLIGSSIKSVGLKVCIKGKNYETINHDTIINIVNNLFAGKIKIDVKIKDNKKGHKHETSKKV